MPREEKTNGSHHHRLVLKPSLSPYEQQVASSTRLSTPSYGRNCARLLGHMDFGRNGGFTSSNGVSSPSSNGGNGSNNGHSSVRDSPSKALSTRSDDNGQMSCKGPHRCHITHS